MSPSFLLVFSAAVAVCCLSLATTPVAAGCLAGDNASVPLNFGGSASKCMPGFYCPNLDASNSSTWNVACQPMPDCGFHRALGDTCDTLQSPFEPVECPAGFYCPNASTKIRCPEGSYCFFASFEATQCAPLSLCPVGSERPTYLGSIILLLLVCIGVGAVVVWYVFLRSLPSPSSFASAKMTREECKKILSRGVKRARVETGLGHALRFDFDDLCVSVKNPEQTGQQTQLPNSQQQPEKQDAPQQDQKVQRDNSGSSISKTDSDVMKTPQPGQDAVASPDQKPKKEESKKPAAVAPPEERKILRGVSGCCAPGKVTAIMGPSGAGKSTLFNTLLRKLDSDRFRITGTCNINGVGDLEKFEEVRSAIAFVPQDDVLHTELSVQDNIWYASEMALPRNWTAEERDQFRDVILELLGLSKHRHTVVGNVEQRGLSGGQRKRCAIACQLAGAPAAIFLDEPTSGLDSTTSLELCRILKEVAVATRANIVMVVHQPRQEIWHALDHLLLLAPGGITVYEGPAQNAVSELSDFLTVRKEDNPADVIMDAVSVHGEEMARRWKLRGKKAVSLGVTPATTPQVDHSPLAPSPAASSAVLAAADKKPQLKIGIESPVVPSIASPEIGSAVKKVTSLNIEGSPSSSFVANGSSINVVESSIISDGSPTHPSNNGGTVEIHNDEISTVPASIRQAHPFKQFLVMHVRAVQKILANWMFLLLEFVILLVLAAILAQGGTQFTPRAVYKAEYSRISPQFLLTFLPQFLMYNHMSLGLAGAVSGVRVFGEEKVRFGRDAEAGLSMPAYFCATSLAALYRIAISSIMYTSIVHAAGQLAIDYWTFLGNFFLTYWCVNTIGCIVSLLTTMEYANVVAAMVAILYSALNGFISFPKWLKVLSFAFWSCQQTYVEYFKKVEHFSEPPYDKWNYDNTVSAGEGIGIMLAMAVFYNGVVLALLMWMVRRK